MGTEEFSAVDHTPTKDRCERCGAGPEADLRRVIFKGRDRFAERTLCDLCSEEAFEAFISTVGP